MCRKFISKLWKWKYRSRSKDIIFKYNLIKSPTSKDPVPPSPLDCIRQLHLCDKHLVCATQLKGSYDQTEEIISMYDFLLIMIKHTPSDTCVCILHLLSPATRTWN